MERVFFHIGLHKTATTWFQRHLFPNLAGIECRRSKRIEALGLHRPNGPTLLVTHESLSGMLASDKQPGDSKRRLLESLSRIAAVARGAPIIVAFREHGSWLGAAYAHKAKKEGVDFSRYKQTFSKDDLSWCRSLDLIEETSPRIFPFLYEELVASPESLIADLCRFLDTPTPANLRQLLGRRENPSPRSSQGQAVSRPFYRISHMLDRIPGVDTKALREFGARFGARFDDRSATRGKTNLEPDLSAELRHDWQELLIRIGRHRGRDFSAFSQPDRDLD
jgi:hypothetical protein